MSELNLTAFKKLTEEQRKKHLEIAKSEVYQKESRLQRVRSRLEKEFTEDAKLSDLNPMIELENRLDEEVKKDKGVIRECEHFQSQSGGAGRTPAYNGNFDSAPSPSSTLSIRPEIYSIEELKEKRKKDNILTADEMKEEKEKRKKEKEKEREKEKEKEKAELENSDFKK